MFDALEYWDIFDDGEETTRSGNDNRKTENVSNSVNTNSTSNSLTNKSTTSTTNTSDRRYSDLPQNQLQNIKDGSYVTKYNYDTDTNSGTDNSTSNGNSNSTANTESKNNITDDNTYNETIKRTVSDKISILKEMQTNISNIYTMIFKELNCLFYQLV